MRLRQGWAAIPIPCLVHSTETELISDIAGCNMDIDNELNIS